MILPGNALISQKNIRTKQNSTFLIMISETIQQTLNLHPMLDSQ